MRWFYGAALAGLVVGARPEMSPKPGECDKHQKPFKVRADSVKDVVRVIAMFPVHIERAMSTEARRRGAVLDSFLTVELERGGFQMVPPPVVDSAWNEVSREVGGVYDPATGRPDSIKQREINERFLRTMHETFKADAVLEPRVREVSADFNNGKAVWDGTKQGFENFGQRFLSGLSGGPYKGTTNALSLLILLGSLDRRLLYEGWGGIQILSSPRGGNFHEVPDSVLFADSLRVRESVRIALCHLVSPKSGGD